MNHIPLLRLEWLGARLFVFKRAIYDEMFGMFG